jgi:hypothetical protein
VTGTYRTIVAGDETVRAFIPYPLPPSDPPLVLEGDLARLHSEALVSIGQLAVAGAMVPSADWFLYGFVRKERVREGTSSSRRVRSTRATRCAATEKDSRPA